MNLKMEFEKIISSSYNERHLQDEFLLDDTIGRTNPSSRAPQKQGCCKNKECLQCYGGVFKKASPDELASRDIFVQPKSLKKDTDTTCVICLASFAKHKFIWKLSCNHYFHYKCIERWSNLENYTCPLCRKYYEYP